MEPKKLKVIPPADPRLRSIIVPTFDVLPVIRGAGGQDYECGSCGAVLLKGLGPNQHIQGVVVRCPKCHADNDVYI